MTRFLKISRKLYRKLNLGISMFFMLLSINQGKLKNMQKYREDEVNLEKVVNVCRAEETSKRNERNFSCDHGSKT